jgi:citrate synthase
VSIVAENGLLEVPRGLDKVVVDTTSIAATDKDGWLIYRGYKATELAAKLHFEKAAYLVVYGSIPNDAKLKRFSSFLESNSSIDGATDEVIGLLPMDAKVIDGVRSVVSMLPLRQKKPDMQMLEMAAKMPRIISNCYRAKRSMKPLGCIEGNYAERFYYLLTGKEDVESARYFERLLILYMEHEFNASTFALRVTASTLADPQAAFTTALATIKGPLHGGANAEILNYMLKMKRKSEAVELVDRKLGNKEKIMGFGHRIYKTMDPRAQFIKGQLRTLSKSRKMGKLLEMAEAVEKEMWVKKGLPANLDFYAAIYMYLLGIDEAFYTPIFAAARSFGWAAHYMEQVANNKLIRPDSRYTGRTGLKL